VGDPISDPGPSNCAYAPRLRRASATDQACAKHISPSPTDLGEFIPANGGSACDCCTAADFASASDNSIANPITCADHYIAITGECGGHPAHAHVNEHARDPGTNDDACISHDYTEYAQVGIGCECVVGEFDGYADFFVRRRIAVGGRLDLDVCAEAG
jgi:hypothetical protein